MRATGLSLTDFRCYRSVQLALPDGVTAITGANGQGKTSLLEALAWTATARSFRGVPDAALVRSGAEAAVIRTELDVDDRPQLVEVELRATGRNRLRVNRQPITRTRDLLGRLRVTVFAPDDLQLVKGPPAERRAYLDDLLVMLAPRYEGVRADFERVLRQRNALLRGGVSGEHGPSTLAVFDEQLVRAGGELVQGRLRLAARLEPAVASAYRDLAGDETPVTARYEAEWAEGSVAPDVAEVDGLLRHALRERHRQELDRGVTLVGPHRDEWRLRLGGLDARTHASQGEQRTLALALRLGGHALSVDLAGDAPVLLLDDVFSELDGARSSALVDRLPPGQALVTSAGAVPPGIEPRCRLRVGEGRVEEET